MKHFEIEMAGKVPNIKICCQLKLRSDLQEITMQYATRTI